MAKNYEELGLSDDFMFGKVMEDGDLCREVLECLLGQKVGKLEPVQTQKEYRYAVDGHGSPEKEAVIPEPAGDQYPVHLYI